MGARAVGVGVCVAVGAGVEVGVPVGGGVAVGVPVGVSVAGGGTGVETTGTFSVLLGRVKGA